ncbi:hypothetical protein ACSFA3_14450 [Variovorax sp. RHLX14]|uniref:hypothetical protein n=1 Tax=Variovorax sp. RHLX14 TaxID=1259731 RepID=UPI003F460B78
MTPSLRRKPGAFARCVLRDAMFPRCEYAQAWRRISERLSERDACRLMVSVLDLADRANVVAELAVVLDALRERNEVPDIEVLRAQFAPRPMVMSFVQVQLPTTAAYDVLLGDRMSTIAATRSAADSPTVRSCWQS